MKKSTNLNHEMLQRTITPILPVERGDIFQMSLEHLQALPAQIAYSHSPQMAWQVTNITAPLDAENAKSLRQRMARRYYEWTGRQLWADLNEDRNGK